MAQPDAFTQNHGGCTIIADKQSVEVRDGDKVLYHRKSPDNQNVCAMTNLQCGKVWVDGRG